VGDIWTSYPAMIMLVIQPTSQRRRLAFVKHKHNVVLFRIMITWTPHLGRMDHSPHFSLRTPLNLSSTSPHFEACILAAFNPVAKAVKQEAVGITRVFRKV
ncbi:hypothetical protein M8C21_026431, partial [Ambrosia artemisiifolia]